MARISQETIERVRNAADILDVVSRYVVLKRRGRNYFGLCPFHHEKTPSFSVAPEKEIYHCFGCGAGGNVFNFIMEYEKLSFVEAVKNLGDRYGIPVELSRDKGAKELFSQLYDLHMDAANFYHDQLLSEKGRKTLAYLKERGLQEATIKQFKIGLAEDRWDAFYNQAKKAGYTPEVLDKSGLFSRSERGVFDRFRGRIMFPIFNTAGKIIAFGGRALDPGDPAKYLNSPETPLYHKSDVFYGLHASREAIRKTGYAILVEGYMDFLQLYQAGIRNLIAASGTALTERHVSQIRKFADRVVLVYDGDQAGVKAAIRAGYLLYKGGIEPRILPLPEGLDPDDWIREKGAESFRAALDETQPVLKFHLTVRKAVAMKGAERSRFIKEILDQIAGIPDGIVRDDLVRELSQELRIDELELVKQLHLERRRGRTSTESETTRTAPADRFTSQVQKAQLELVKVLAGPDHEARQLVRDMVNLDLFTERLLRRLSELLMPLYEEIDYAAIIDHFDTKEDRETVARILMEESPALDPVTTVKECVTVLAANPIREKIKAARIKIRELEAAGKDPTEVIFEVAQLQQELKALGSH
ncbi:MAG: DNA primase [FCB group bacterium]|nr:DNA primase [FCB group bacterium]